MAMSWSSSRPRGRRARNEGAVCLGLPPNNSLKPWEITPAQNAGPSAGSTTDPPGRTPETFGRRAGLSATLESPASLA